MKIRPGISAQETEIGGAVAPPLRPLASGSEIAGYRIESLLGRGGMGVVHRAQHVHLGRAAALKVLTPELARDRGFRDRFIRESRLAASIHHPAIVTVYDAGEADGLLYIAMRYVDGTDLARLLEKGPMPAPDAVAVVEQLAGALDAAHAHGLVHRDVKPANVLVDDDGFYLADFGLTKRAGSNSGLTGAGQMVGTIQYAAPEQIEGGAVDGRADVYALGCVLYHAVTGEPPYPRDSDVQVMYAHLQAPPPSPSGVAAGLPRGLDDVVARAMAKAPDDRFASAGALAAAARAALGGGPGREEPSETETAAARALVVSDDAASRALVRGALRSTAVEVAEARDTESALAAAAESAPGLVIVDCPDPQQMVAALRAHPAAQGAPILAVVARGGDSGGADASLAKPFSAVQLMVKVRDLLGPETLRP